MRFRSFLVLLLIIPASLGHGYHSYNDQPAKSTLISWLKHLHTPVPAFCATGKKANTDTTSLQQSSWYAETMKGITEKEYEIRYDKTTDRYASPNRKNNLRAYYSANQFTLVPRNDSADKWKLDLTIKGIYSGRNKVYTVASKPVVTGKGEDLQFNNNDEFITEYVNNKEGIRQNFIINKKPVSASECIRIKLQASKNWFVNKVDQREIHFSKATQTGYENKIIYNGLKVWDAENKELDASFTVSNNNISIDVCTRNAVYPITIDPVSTTPAVQLESNQVSAFMGFSVASAGDVNGDGYSDVIVGAYLYDNGQTDEGAAFVYHGSATGISSIYTTLLESNQANAYFGYSVATAGDVNGDGYSDVIVGAYAFDNGQTDEGAAFVYHGSATGVSNAYTTLLESNQASAAFGRSVACAGDVNGDGYSDVIVGANFFTDGESFEGAAFVYHGSASGISNVIVTQLESNQVNGNFGRSVASAGDVNGDGYSDVIVGASQYSDGQAGEGVAFVYHGSASGINTTIKAMLECNLASAQFGISVSCAGDVNGDGYSDVIVGGNTYSNGQSNEGVIAVFLGAAAGVSTVPATQVESNQATGQLGYSVAGAGDINGDGYSDIIVGAYTYSNGQANEGVAYVYFGSATGINIATPTLLEMNQASANFGVSVACAGDVNGDGYSDLIIGANQYDNGQTDEGAAFVYHGSAGGISNTIATQIERDQNTSYVGFSVACAGDVNADGYSDVVVGARTYDNGTSGEGAAFVFHGSSAGLSTTPATMVSSGQFNAFMGNSVACAGDVNGDGYSDIIVGSILYDNGETDEGAAFIYLGSASGINPVFATRLERNQVSAEFGCCVAGAGDVNGDGYSDVIVGAEFYDNGQTDEGAAFVYLGSATGISNTVATQLEKNQASAGFGYNVNSAGDVNGDGYGDVIVGAPTYDNGQTDEGAAFIYLGSAAGLNTVAATQLESNQASAELGVSTACAGDVNGDGYSDVIVGAPYYDNGQTDEGMVFVYHGSSIGLSTVATTTIESNQVNAQLGFSVASAGDVNGDGYSDVIVGAWLYDNGSTDEGAAFIYLGSTTGISNSVSVQMEINQVSAYFGYSVASAGDVNGDGLSDVIVGAPNYDDVQTDEGGAFVFLGHGGAGTRNNLRLYNTDLITPIQHSNYTNPNLFGAGVFARSPLGRQKARLVWEVKAQGLAFSGSPITNSTTYFDRQIPYTDLGIAGTQLKSQVQKRGRQTKIRARVEYSRATAINGQIYGPWKYPPGYTMGAYGMNSVPLPLTLIAFNGQFVNADDVQLAWITANEINMHSFILEKSIDGTNFIAAGELPAKGIGSSREDYSFLDQHVNANLLYYRLKLVEQNNDISYSNIITLSRNKVVKGFIAPDPVNRGGDAILTLQSTTDKNAVTINIFNTAGQNIHTETHILQKGKNEIRIFTRVSARGMYVVTVSGIGMKESYRLLIQ